MESDKLEHRIAAAEARIRELLAVIARLDVRLGRHEHHAIETNRAVLELAKVEDRVSALEEIVQNLVDSSPPRPRGISPRRARAKSRGR